MTTNENEETEFIETEPLVEIEFPLQRGRLSSKDFRKETIKIRHYCKSTKEAEENTQNSTEEKKFDHDRKKHYVVKPADCDGTIVFKDSPRKTPTKFVRFFGVETKEKNLYELLINHWGLKSPTLLISVTGGAKSFDISPRLKRDFIEGIRKVASTPGAWVISGGTDTGVMKMVGDANRGTENTCIGVVTWGVLRHRETLEATAANNGNVHCYPREGSYLNLPDGESYLDENHSHFLLVDDGTEGNWGVEIEFRNKFEKYIMNPTKKVKEGTPTVLLVIEGGPNTLRTVDLAIKSKIPCVIINGSGRAANVVAFACEFAEKIVEANKDCCKKKCLRLEPEIRKLLHGPMKEEEFNELYEIAVTCALRKEMFTIVDVEDGLDTDDAILTALLNDTHARKSMYDKLRFTLLWNRVDLAEKMLGPLDQWISQDRDKDKIDKKVQGQDQGPAGKPILDQQGKEELERILIMALAMNNVQFVRLLVDYGVSLRSLLTRQVLEILYAYRWPTRPSALKGEIKRKSVDNAHLTQDRKNFFLSVSQCLNFNSVVPDKNDVNTDKEIIEDNVFKIDLRKIRDHVIHELLKDVPSKYIEKVINVSNDLKDGFEHPYRQLFVWAVFNDMREMAVYLWQFVDDALATSLLAVAMTDNMRKEMRSRLHNVQDSEEEHLTSSLMTYKDLSISLLDTCHKDNEDDTVVLVSRKSKIFSAKCSNLDFAFCTGQKEFVAHRAIQDILDDEWYGSIKSNHSSARILAAVFFPPLLAWGMTIEPPKKGGVVKDEPQRKGGVAKDEPPVKDVGFFMKLKYFHVDSPIVTFLEHTLGYIMFLLLFAYVAMSQKDSTMPDYWEIVLIVTIAGYAVSEVYQMTMVRLPTFPMKVMKHLSDLWNLFDVVCISTFFVGLTLRCFDECLELGHLLYAIDVGLWIVRIIHMFYADPISGPYVVLIGKLFKNFLGFLGILVIVLASYGITVRAILEPGPGSDQMFVAAVYKPYFHLFGELFLDNPESTTTRFGTPKTKYNSYREPIALILLGAYLLTANIVLLNLLIAIFSNTYEKVIPNASRMWKFQRYKLILEYSTQRTVLFPPLNLLEHVCIITYRFVKFCISKCKCCQKKSFAVKAIPSSVPSVPSSSSKAVLSVRHMKRETKAGQEEALEQVLFLLERRCFNKVMRMREGLETAENESNGGSSGMTRSELEKHFFDQQENYEHLERRMAQIQTLVEKIKPLRNGEDEKNEEVEEASYAARFNTIEKRRMKRASTGHRSKSFQGMNFLEP